MANEKAREIMNDLGAAYGSVVSAQRKMKAAKDLEGVKKTQVVKNLILVVSGHVKKKVS